MKAVHYINLDDIPGTWSNNPNLLANCINTWISQNSDKDITSFTVDQYLKNSEPYYKGIWILYEPKLPAVPEGDALKDRLGVLELGLTAKEEAWMETLGITTIGELRSRSKRQMKIRNFGKISLRTLKAKAKAFGVELHWDI